MRCRVCGREFDPRGFQVVVPGLGMGFDQVDCALEASAGGVPLVASPPPLPIAARPPARALPAVAMAGGPSLARPGRRCSAAFPARRREPRASRRGYGGHDLPLAEGLQPGRRHSPGAGGERRRGLRPLEHLGRDRPDPGADRPATARDGRLRRRSRGARLAGRRFGGRRGLEPRARDHEDGIQPESAHVDPLQGRRQRRPRGQAEPSSRSAAGARASPGAAASPDSGSGAARSDGTSLGPCSRPDPARPRPARRLEPRCSGRRRDAAGQLTASPPRA